MSLAIACVVLDALTAYPPSHMDLVGPSAMRITALVLVVCTAAPMVCPRYASTQICILSSCLIVVAWTGLHQGTIYCRLTDASYIIIVGLLLFISSVFNNTHTAGHKQGVVHPFVVVLSFMLYAGARLLRHAVLMCAEVSDRVVMRLDPPADGLNAAGCSVCNAFAVVCLACSGASAMLAAFVILLRVAVEPTATSQEGLSNVTMVLSVSAWLQFMGTIGSFFSVADTASALQVLYGEGSCSYGDPCRGAVAFRRFNVITHGTGGSTMLLLCTVATISCVRNVYTHQVCRPVPISHGRHIFISGLFMSACLVLFVGIVENSDWGHTHMYTDIAAVLVLAGIAVSGFLSGWEIFGALTIITAVTLEVVCHTFAFWAEVGLNVSYFTVFSNLILLGLFFTHSLIHIVLFLMKPGAYSRWTTVFFRESQRRTQWVGLLQLVSSYILVAGRSVATFLLLASTSLVAVYDGGDLPRRDGLYPERRGTYAFLIWHFAPAIAWSLLVSYSRCWAHHKHPTRAQEFVAWIASGVASVVLYLCVLSVGGGGLPSDYPSEMSVLFVANIGSVLPPWIAYGA